jgi:fatty-acyl-CoA synthase
MPGGASQTLRSFLWRAANLYPETEIVSRTHDGVIRYTYGEYADRVAQLGHALTDRGLDGGARVGTVCWNHHRHFETYFGVPNLGSQLHTINPLLPAEQIQYIVTNAADDLLFVDPSLIEPLEAAYTDDPDAFDSVEEFVVIGETVPETAFGPVTPYESLLEGQPTSYDWPDVDGDTTAGMCYTSGTTGKPKGVEYTQQMLFTHTLGMLTPQGIPMTDADAVMPVVPMFHVNAWGFPYAAAAAGAKQVFPGPSPEPADLADLVASEGVTLTAGVPTVWLGLRQYLEETGETLPSLERISVGGSAAPEALVRWFDDRDTEVVHAWGMTETSPIASLATVKAEYHDAGYEAQLERRTKQGLILPGLEFTVIDDDGDEVAWNGEDFGELWVRGPWVTTEYFGRPAASDANFDGDYLKTGDVVTVDADGYIEIVDRAKDVIKSGGEWISTVELENTLMAHDDVREAAVIGVPHERWQERPLGLVVPEAGVDRDALMADLDDLIESEYPRWWTPDDFITIDEVPKTATGKFDKKVLRDEYGDESYLEGQAPDDAAPEDD